MWIVIGNGFLNLDNVVSVHFVRGDAGALTATVETFTGHAKHYQGDEAETLRKGLSDLAAGHPQAALRRRRE
jgi:hypothetical protein